MGKIKKPALSVLKILVGGLLLGFLWRVRGTNGWGSSWGLLNAGAVYLFYLNLICPRRYPASLSFIGVASLSFMLTCPAWGTFLEQITGILSVSAKNGDAAQYEISPVSGIVIMLLLGFGLASVYGVLLGKAFGDRKWSLRHYAAVLFGFIATDLLAKASVSHLLLRLIQPQAVSAFQNGLAAAGEAGRPYLVYMKHFSMASYAKTLVGGRNYFSSVGTISLVVAAIAVFLIVRFYVKDRFAAKTGVFVSASFACSITVSDLFFFFAAGGYHGAQGFSLPQGFAAWSLWEFFTGFFAGIAITAWILLRHTHVGTLDHALERLPEKTGKTVSYLLAVVPAIGINLVRPVLVRIENKTVAAIVSAVLVLAILAVSIPLYKKYGGRDDEKLRRNVSGILAACLTLYIAVVYFFVGRPEIASIDLLHNQLAAGAAVCVVLFTAVYCYKTRKNFIILSVYH